MLKNQQHDDRARFVLPSVNDPNIPRPPGRQEGRQGQLQLQGGQRHSQSRVRGREQANFPRRQM